MRLFHLHRRQFLPASIEAAWKFFTNPFNLAQITPPWLDLRITNSVCETIYPGLIITYRLKALFKVPATWVTEITQVEKPRAFVDEMRMGPYRFWHHQHLFRAVSGGVDVEDRVHYALKFGVLGLMLHGMVIRTKLDEIFDYRRSKLEKLF